MDFGSVSGKRTSPDGARLGSTEPGDEKGHGSSNFKRKRSGLVEDPEVDLSSRKGVENFAAYVESNLWPSVVDDGQKMLSFSTSQSPTTIGIVGGGSGRNTAFTVSRTEHHGIPGGGTAVMEGTRGPFTPCQWMELEHQALIYKYIVANVPVPYNLLSPLLRSLYSYGSPGSYASNFVGWGPFHLGYTGSNDPEPSRCKRTDGKKWRCSKDAVPDHKYCERHMNRGRYRSRKPVEGRTGHAVSGSTSSKVARVASSSSASVISKSSTPNSPNSMHHQYNPVQPSSVSPSVDIRSRSQGFQGLSFIPSTNDLKSENAQFSDQEAIQNSVLQFLGDWQKGQSTHASDQLKSDWTRLSMSIPMAHDLSPSSSSAQDRSVVSTLSLGTSHDHGQTIQKQSLRFPVIWGTTMGGPLGEALTSPATVGDSYLSVESRNSSPHVESSPTGVLQKSSFVSLSNSSYGSSPPSIDNKEVSDLLGSVLASSARTNGW